MESDRYTQAISAFDDYHRKDPDTETAEGQSFPKEWLYAERMSGRLASFDPAASEVIRLAVRCQHIGRWEIPRDRYPMDRKGYLQWRNAAKAHHAHVAGEILAACGYDETVITQVKNLLLKKELQHNPDTQLLEDVACLVFLEYYAGEFATRHRDEKMVDILRKTLRKMSEKAKKAAVALKLPSRIRALLEQAMSPL